MEAVAVWITVAMQETCQLAICGYWLLWLYGDYPCSRTQYWYRSIPLSVCPMPLAQNGAV